MKINISHPYKENISLNFGQFTQVVGQDQQLKYYIWQILLWYFGGKKYSEEDLVLFEQNEPRVLIDDTIVSRSEFSVIQISNINDLIEQMEYKKGTVAYGYIKKKITSIEIKAPKGTVVQVDNKGLVNQVKKYCKLTDKMSSYREDFEKNTIGTPIIISKSSR